MREEREKERREIKQHTGDFTRKTLAENHGLGKRVADYPTFLQSVELKV